MDKIRIFIVLWLFLSFTTQSVTSEISETKLKVEYLVNSSNNSTNTWYMNSTNIYSYQIQPESSIFVEISDLSDYNSTINISLGNLVENNTILSDPLNLTSITDGAAESALAIGYWLIPNQLGFVANQDWDGLINELESLNLNSTLYSKSMNAMFLGKATEVVHIEFKDDFQSTILMYDKQTGLLLTATTKVFGFVLDFAIIKIEDNTNYFAEFRTNPMQTTSSMSMTPMSTSTSEESTVTSSLSFTSFFIVILGIGIVNILNNKKQKLQ